MGLVQTVDLHNYRSAYKVSGVSLHSDLTVVVGPNGSGKSTFLDGIATFGRANNIRPSKLSEYDPSLTNEYPSNIPITTLTISLEAQTESVFIALAERPGIESLEITDNSLTNVLGEQIELNRGLPSGKQDFTLTRYANGCHQLHTTTGRYKLETLIRKRTEDLQEIGAALIEQAVSIGLLDAPTEATSLDTEELSTIVERIKRSVSLDENREDKNEPQVENEVFRDLEDTLEFLLKLEALKGAILDHLPTIAHFEDIPSLPNGVPVAQLDSKAPFQGLVSWGGVDPENIDNIGKEQLSQALTAGAEQLTIYLNSYIELTEPAATAVSKAVTDPLEGRYEVCCEIEDEVVQMYIKDDEEDTIVSVDRKSTGFQWLVSFLLTVFSDVRPSEEADMFLIDDIGVHLHPDWKVKLRRALHELTGDAQIVYSTHSPFFIDNNSLDQVRVTSIGSDGTSIKRVSEAQGSDNVHDILEPLRSSLGAYVAEFLFGASEIVIVEGSTDKEYLQCFSSLFVNSDDRPSLNEDIAIIVGKGSNQIVLANFLEAEQDNYISLMDKDQAGDNQVDSFEESDIDVSKATQLDFLPNQITGQRTEIEDLFPDEMVCEVVADHLSPVVTKADLLQRVNNRPNKGVLQAIEGRLKQYSMEGDLSGEPDIPKGPVCEDIKAEVDESWLDAEGEKAQTIEDFTNLIEHINTKLD